MATDLAIRDTRIGEDRHGNICLNDIWVLAGSPENKRARDWLPAKRVAAVKKILDQRIGESFPNSAPPPTYAVVGKGRASRTYAHPVLALDYAAYLDANLAVEVNEVFLRVKAKDVTLALEMLGGMTAQAEFDKTRVDLRNLLKEHNKLSAAAGAAAGVKDFPAYNGAGLRGLYGGMNKAQVTAKKGLPHEAHHLDHAGHEELAANYFKATQAQAKLKREGITGQGAADRKSVV